MLEILNAIPRSLILPPSNLFLLVVIGLVIWRWRPRAGRAIAATGFALLALLSTTAVADFLVTPLENMTTPLTAPKDAGAQAIVVLAAGQLRDAPEYGGRSIPDYVALARLRYAAHLQRATGLPLLVSGGFAGKPLGNDRVYSFGDAMAAALREDFGVPVQWVERGSRDTAENAAFSAAMLRAQGVTRVLLVTDAMHMARSHAAFERAGLEVVDAPTVFLRGQAKSASAWVPSAEGMRRSWYASYELIGLGWYKLRSGGRVGLGGAPYKVLRRKASIASTVGSTQGSNSQNECGVPGSATVSLAMPCDASLAAIASRPTEKRGTPLMMNSTGGLSLPTWVIGEASRHSGAVSE